ncbi:aminodeoxychorismate lyase [Anaerobacillus sp. CMMVII]|uniref:aminodeoxychorismate lyase n=1 Tax=Anaerobacillus sp. CMMVII TaxID=2755588 RepID=UPI0021B7C02B|nr:aminodeoxychorismate lyase [Anaerobacillus sp. CMMVII]MCT8136394.1 aminodeoxychorismate lyase [Anaerobacillus sp. CMMVII]
MYIYLNGEYVLQAEAKISPFDHGFLYGLGVFETFRIYDGHPFLLDDHFQRLARSLRELNISLSLTKAELLEIIEKLLEKNKLQDAYIRFNVSAGEAPIGLQTEPYKAPNVIIFMKPIGRLDKIKKAAILNTVRNTPEGRERLKSHHYLNNVLGKREVPDLDTEGIFLTSEGFVAEGIVSNIFWVKKGEVYTPSVKTGILNGITRRFILQLLKKYNIPCHEGCYDATQLAEADEVFITNSIQEVVGITTLDEHRYPSERKMTQFLQRTYEECKKQRLYAIKELEERI